MLRHARVERARRVGAAAERLAGRVLGHARVDGRLREVGKQLGELGVLERLVSENEEEEEG